MFVEKNGRKLFTLYKNCNKDFAANHIPLTEKRGSVIYALKTSEIYARFHLAKSTKIAEKTSDYAF